MDNSNKTAVEHKERRVTKKSVIVTAVKVFLAAAVIYFAAFQVARNWDEVVHYRWSLSIGWLLLSVAAHMFTFALFARVWCYLISGFGYEVPWRYSFKISYIASLGRYIPGKIWPIFGMAYLARQIKINEEAAVASWVIVQLFSLPSAFLASFIVILIYPELISAEVSGYMGAGLYALTSLIILMSLLLLFAPGKAFAAFNLLLKIAKRPTIQFHLKKKVGLKIYFGYLVCWICFGISFWTFLRGIIPEPSIPLLAATGVYVFAYQIGYVAIFSPGGLGVRELALTIMLAPYLGPVSAGVAVAARLWNIFSEFIAAVIALKIKLPKMSDDG